MPMVRKFISDKRREPFSGIPCETIFGRTRHFVITNINRNHVENESINTPIQSVASDLTVMSVIEISRIIKEKHLNAQIVNNVHDSIILEVEDDPEIIRTIATIGKTVMAQIPEKYIPNISVPFRADVEVGYKWGELKKYEL